MYIDTHAHLQFDSFDSDRDEVVKRAVDNGVNYIVNVGINLEDSRTSLEIANRYENVYSTVGFHPYDVEALDSEAEKSMIEMLSNSKIVAVGEIGLDYCKAQVPKDIQIEKFQLQLRMAIDNELPVIIHTRDAWEDIEDVIAEVTTDKINGIFHCYSGDLETALRLIKKGFLISFAGNVTFKNYKQIEMLQEIPIEKMLIETDSPFLAPHPHRGRRNEPGYVPLIAKRLAEIKGLSVDDVARITLYNASRLFGISTPALQQVIAYPIRDSLYINATNRCSANCVFCPRLKEPVVKGHNLKLHHEPTFEETIEVIGDPTRYREIVFCGFGEPTIRLEYLKQVAGWLKERGAYVRLNSNGHGNIINDRDITPELASVIDEVSVSINTHDPDQYSRIMRTEFNGSTYESMLDFLRSSSKAGIRTVATVVGIPGLDIEKCRAVAESVGAEFRVRKHNDVG